MNSPCVPVEFLQPSEACDRYHGSSWCGVQAVTVLWRVGLICRASGSFPSASFQWGRAPAIQVWAYWLKHECWRKQNNWLFHHALVFTLEIASLEVFLGKKSAFWAVFLPQNTCGLGDKRLTSLLWNIPERSQRHLNPDFLLPSVEASVPRGQAEQWLLSRGSKAWIKIEWNEIAVSLQLWNALIRVHPCTAVLSKAITSAYW